MKHIHLLREVAAVISYKRQEGVSSNTNNDLSDHSIIFNWDQNQQVLLWELSEHFSHSRVFRPLPNILIHNKITA